MKDCSVYLWFRDSIQISEKTHFLYQNLLIFVHRVGFFRKHVSEKTLLLHILPSKIFVGNKAKGRISKRMLQENKANQIL